MTSPPKMKLHITPVSLCSNLCRAYFISGCVVVVHGSITSSDRQVRHVVTERRFVSRFVSIQRF